MDNTKRIAELEGELTWQEGLLEDLRNEDPPGGCVELEAVKGKIEEIRAELKELGQ